jgi:methylated-DNA-[protein]-cysteine S-methyltransferase
MTPRTQPDPLSELFAEAREPDETLLEVLHAELVRRADEDDVLDVAYRTMDSPYGTVLLAATDHGLVRVAFELEGFAEVLQDLADAISPRILLAPRRLDDAARQLDEYFVGRRQTFELSLDLVLAKGFRRSVLEYLPHLAYGTTASYGSVAAAVHHPKAARAVGTACATNPLPLIIPCHRVIKHDGTVGSYLAGASVKRQLLALEHSA